MISWVVGGSGLLGSAVSRALETATEQRYEPSPVRWGTSKAVGDLLSNLGDFVAAAAGQQWTIYWCAGAAVTDSDPAQLDQEFAVLSAFLAALGRIPSKERDRGSMVFASSAGAVYGGAAGPPFTEQTLPVPLGHYGQAKLRAETALRDLADKRGFRILVARIANLYGPGQSLAKQQGLISRLCYSAVTRTPVSVFVSLDTLRDYIYVDDCAARLLSCAQRMHGETVPWQVKIIASGRSTSIADVLGQFRRASGARPLVVTGWSGSAALQSRDLRLRSLHWADLDAGPLTTLPAGIHQTITDLRLTRLQAGQLSNTGR